MGGLLYTLINLVSGAVGGNIVAWLAKSLNQGTLINSICGIAGGGIGGWLLSALGAGRLLANTGGGFSISYILFAIASGIVGGGIVLAIVGWIRRNMVK